LLAYVGCRISEALALTVHHIDAERFTVTIRTLKRRKLVYRAVPVPQAMIELLRRLPVGADNRFWSMHRVTAWRVIKATMRLAGIAGPTACPKGLRHGFGIRAADRSVPTNLIQRWMAMPRRPRPLSTSTPSGSRNGGLPGACGDRLRMWSIVLEVQCFVPNK
jgi:integrase